MEGNILGNMEKPENFIIKRNDVVGRYGVAGKRLAAGEEVASERPIIVGPKSYSEPVCLGCYRPVDCSTLCQTCKWPVCCSECSKSEDHQPECHVWSEAKAKFVCKCSGPCPQYECITPLRVLLACEADNRGKVKRVIENMESHCDKRIESTKSWNSEEINIVQYLRKACKLSERFGADWIHKVCGVLEVNTFEVITEEGHAIRGVYPNMAVLSHNCIANTAHSVYPNMGYRMVLRTSVDVDEGEELFSSYCGSLEPTMVRREILKATKYFDCCCTRCRHKEELGTRMSTLKCATCPSAPDSVLSTDPLDDGSAWECSDCGSLMTADEVRDLYTRIKALISGVDEMPFGPEKLQAAEKVLESMDGYLGANHGLRVGLWYTLVQLYGRVEGYTVDTMPEYLLERKRKLCTDLLSAIDTIEPGYTRIRGLVLYELHMVEIILGRSRHEAGETSSGKFKEAMSKVATLLAESVNILSLEPDTCLEGAISRQAKASLQQLNRSIRELP